VHQTTTHPPRRGASPAANSFGHSVEKSARDADFGFSCACASKNYWEHVLRKEAMPEPFLEKSATNSGKCGEWGERVALCSGGGPE